MVGRCSRGGVRRDGNPRTRNRRTDVRRGRRRHSTTGAAGRGKFYADERCEKTHARRDGLRTDGRTDGTRTEQRTTTAAAMRFLVGAGRPAGARVTCVCGGDAVRGADDDDEIGIRRSRRTGAHAHARAPCTPRARLTPPPERRRRASFVPSTTTVRWRAIWKGAGRRGWRGCRRRRSLRARRPVGGVRPAVRRGYGGGGAGEVLPRRARTHNRTRDLHRSAPRRTRINNNNNNARMLFIIVVCYFYV